MGGLSFDLHQSASWPHGIRPCTCDPSMEDRTRFRSRFPRTGNGTRSGYHRLQHVSTRATCGAASDQLRLASERSTSSVNAGIWTLLNQIRPQWATEEDRVKDWLGPPGQKPSQRG